MCEKTLFDYISTFLPILLSALLIIENLIFHFRNKKLQQEIHNRDIRLRKHDDILKIYSVYYEVSDFLYANNIVLGVKEGNVPYIMELPISFSFNEKQYFKKIRSCCLNVKKQRQRIV